MLGEDAITAGILFEFLKVRARAFVDPTELTGCVGEKGGEGSCVAIDCGGGTLVSRSGWRGREKEPFFGDEFGGNMDKGTVAKAGFPVGEVAESVFGGAVVFDGAVGDILIEKLAEGVKLFVLIEFVLAELDLALGFAGPVLGLRFSFEMLANCGVAFDADDCAPAFTVFSFIN